MDEEKIKDPTLLELARALERLLLLSEQRVLPVVEKLAERVDANPEEARRSSEEMQRNVEFIIRQQAQFTSDMQQLRESQANSERRWERTEESVRALLAIAQSHEDETNALRESQARLTEAQVRTSSQMAETDERLNALINVVERHITEGRNGGGA
jgi:AcrR family transcriptional regulator